MNAPIQSDGPKRVRVRLSGVGDQPRRNVEVLVHDDGRVFVSETAWLRLTDPDPRVSDQTRTDLRGSIDWPVPLTFDGLLYRTKSKAQRGPGHVEVTVRREGHIAVLYEGARRIAIGHSELKHHNHPHNLAQDLMEGRWGEPISDDVSDLDAFICRHCGNTGKIDVGACGEPRCIKRRATIETTQPPARRLVHT